MHHAHNFTSLNFDSIFLVLAGKLVASLLNFQIDHSSVLPRLILLAQLIVMLMLCERESASLDLNQPDSPIIQE